MKNFENYIKEAEVKLERVFETLEKELNDYRIKHLIDRLDDNIDDETYFTYVRDSLNSITDNLILLNVHLTTAICKTQEAVEKYGDEHYIIAYALNYLAVAMKKSNLYNDIFDIYRQDEEEANEYFNQKNGGKA